LLKSFGLKEISKTKYYTTYTGENSNKNIFSIYVYLFLLF